MQVTEVKCGWAGISRTDRRTSLMVLVIFKLPESHFSYVGYNVFNRWTGERTLPHSVRVNPEDPGKRELDPSQEDVPNPLCPDPVHDCVTAKVKQACEQVARKWARSYRDEFGPGIPS